MLADSLEKVRGRIDGYRSSVRAIITKNPAAEAYSASVGSGMSGLDDHKRSGALSNQYRAAMTGIPYTAIRPAAVKIAGQPLHVGFKRDLSGEDAEPPLRTKVAATQRKRTGRKLLSKDIHLSDTAPPWVKQSQDNVELVQAHPIMDAIEEPNEHMTQWALMWCTVFSIYATGQCIWVIDEVKDKLRIYYVPTTWATPDHSRGPFSSWKIRPLGSTANTPPIPGENVVHFMLPDPANPLLPHAPLMAHAKAINTDDQIQESQFQSMKNGLRPGMVMRAGRLPAPPGANHGPMRPVLTPEQRKQLINAMQLAYRGVMKHGEPIIVDGMIDEVTPWTRSPEEMDFPDGSKLTESRIMKGFATNPIVAGEVEGANRASAYVAHSGFYEINVNPLLSYMSQIITRRIGPFYSSDRQKVVAWIEEAKAHDKALTDERMKALLESGGATRGEVRHWAATGEVSLQPRDDDDDLLQKPKSPRAPTRAAGDGESEDDESGDDEAMKEATEWLAKRINPYTLEPMS